VVAVVFEHQLEGSYLYLGVGFGAGSFADFFGEVEDDLVGECQSLYVGRFEPGLEEAVVQQLLPGQQQLPLLRPCPADGQHIQPRS
jgi:hypothetical protein